MNIVINFLLNFLKQLWLITATGLVKTKWISIKMSWARYPNHNASKLKLVELIKQEPNYNNQNQINETK